MKKRKVCYIIEVSTQVESESKGILDSLLRSIHTVIESMIDAILSTFDTEKEEVSIKVGEIEFDDEFPDLNSITLECLKRKNKEDT